MTQSLQAASQQQEKQQQQQQQQQEPTAEQLTRQRVEELRLSSDAARTARAGVLKR